jgi:hypothetical protein
MRQRRGMNIAFLFSPAKLWRRFAPRSTAGIVIMVSLVFGGLLALGFYRVHGPAGAASGYRFGVGLGSGSEHALDPDDPVARFAETRVGHVVFVSRASDHCQRVFFDNSTGLQYEARALDCSRPAAEVVASTDRMNALRKTFQQK